MTVDHWLEAARADADRRALPALKPLLETLARMTVALRAADFNERADGANVHSGTGYSESPVPGGNLKELPPERR